ncbi:MAG TPA: hypothetical protein VH143_03045 [Kofleriaceae bacterium]|nr:hypothetical protein [Kofleriaceae bacterium]
MRAITLRWGCVATIIAALSASSFAQPRAHADKNGSSAPTPDDKADKKTTAKDAKNKVKDFNFNGLDLNGRNRTPQLLYFLERANEELERASLEKRSFIPTMVKSVDEEQL